MIEIPCHDVDLHTESTNAISSYLASYVDTLYLAIALAMNVHTCQKHYIIMLNVASDTIMANYFYKLASYSF